MEGVTQGEEVDTKFMIQASKAFNFYLPNPTNPEQSREGEEEYCTNMKNINSLQLIDFD